jgi:pimeloyl-ACP methyl ester carboxylesterase
VPEEVTASGPADANAVYAAQRAPKAVRMPLRELTHRVLTWGDASAPKLFLLHGWMDVAASFQFLVDALPREYHVIAPDLRGFGGSDWQAQGYWFADYVADLEALLDAFAPGEPVNLVGHSLGANVAMQYAGVRPQRIRRLVALDGFGIPAEKAEQATGKYVAWLDALREKPDFAPYESFEAVAQRLRRTNPRLAPDKARYLAQWWARKDADGKVRLNSDPRHKLPFPIVYRVEEVYASWARIAAPTLWVAAEDSHIPRWLNAHPEGEAATDALAEVRQRIVRIPGARLVTIADAGHMLHHDQPHAVARAIDSFVAAA